MEKRPPSSELPPDDHGRGFASSSSQRPALLASAPRMSAVTTMPGKRRAEARRHVDGDQDDRGIDAGQRACRAVDAVAIDQHAERVCGASPERTQRRSGSRAQVGNGMPNRVPDPMKARSGSEKVRMRPSVISWAMAHDRRS